MASDAHTLHLEPNKLEFENNQEGETLKVCLKSTSTKHTLFKIRIPYNSSEKFRVNPALADVRAGDQRDVAVTFKPDQPTEPTKLQIKYLEMEQEEQLGDHNYAFEEHKDRTKTLLLPITFKNVEEDADAFFKTPKSSKAETSEQSQWWRR